MPNGQYHQKNQKRWRYGVKIKNPLRLPVVAWIRCETGAIRSGAMLGRETTRTIGPGDEIFVSTKGSCQLDIDLHVVRYNETGQMVKLGNAEGVHIEHRDPRGKTDRRVPAMPVRVTEEKNREPVQDEEVSIPSLGDRFREMNKEVVRV